MLLLLLLLLLLEFFILVVSLDVIYSFFEFNLPCLKEVDIALDFFGFIPIL